MTDSTEREAAAATCSYCGHTESQHVYERGFYDVHGFHAECDVVGCPCERFRSLAVIAQRVSDHTEARDA